MMEENMLEMTDKEAMYHRFSRVNLKKSTGTIAQILGCSRKEYEDAVKRGMEEEAREWQARKENEEYVKYNI